MITDELVRVNKGYFIKTASMALKTAIYAEFPYLNVAPVNFVINKLIDWSVSKIADGLELVSFFIYIDFRVDKQGKDYVIAAHNANTLQTEESRKIADEKFKIFVNFRT